uniref:GPS domain-containing protein n=1 Tax=Hanusia phi TaxID=3032 RepID=A0A7S0ERQ0_9CRYP|mmetsp:Transcript_2932/g.7040  ORF Transcript_2932/g.7040 Transcript_2932/m.7040 type:complete len:2136 (+) Transcript_2932:22-6429(+)
MSWLGMKMLMVTVTTMAMMRSEGTFASADLSIPTNFRWERIPGLTRPSSSSSSSFLSFYRAGVPRLLFQLNLTSYSSTTIRVENVTSKEIVSGRVFALLVERIVPQVSDRVVLSDSSTQVTVQLLGEEAATLGGQTTVTMSGGVAKFTDLVIDKTGQNFSLLVSASSVEGQTLSARSERFTVLPAQYFRLSIVVQAASAYGGEAFAVQPEIELLDLQNNRATLDDHTKVAVELAPGGGAGAICGRTIRTAVQGLVKFTDLAIDQLGSYSLRFSASSFNETSCFVSLLSSPDANCSCNCSVQGQAFSVEVGRPYRLLGLRDPSNGTGGTALPTQPQVGVVDRGGNLLQEVPSELKVFASLEIPRQDISDFLVLVSSIPTSSILGMLHLRVLQEDYVVFASFEVNGQTSVNSTVLILNTQGQLIPQLNVLTTGASDWSAFKVEEEHFLVLSNLFDETSLLFDVPSHVYKFIPGDQPALLLLHHLPTVGAIGVEAFQIGRTPMAAIACQGDGTGPARSIIFSFNASGHAEVVQEVETHMAQGVAHLAIGCVDYLVFTNSFNFSSATGQGSALVLRWEEVAFAAHQLLPLDSPTAVSAYVASSRSLLLIGSRFGNSSLFVFDGEAFRLLPPLASALRMERLSSFEYGGTSMVGFASSALDSTGSATVGLITQPKLLEEGGNFVWETSASSSALPLASSVSDVLHVRTFAGPDLLLVSEKERTSVFALHPRKALAGQTFAVFVNGTGGGNAVATFEDLAVPEAGRWNFRFTAVNLEEGRTAPFLVRVGPRHSLSILVQPAQGRGGEVLLVQPRLRFLDAGGNWIGDAEGDVVNAVLQQEDSTLCLNSSNGSSAVTVGGVANFTDLVINRVGGDYTFLFSSSSFNVSSINVTVLPGTPTSFRWLRSPAENETVGQVLSSQPLLVAMDAACNDAAPHLLRIRISFSYDPSGMAGLMGSTTILREGPIVAFTDLSIDRTGSRFQLRLELERSNSAPSSSWNESGAVPIPARFAGGDVSSFFSVLPQPAGSLVSTRRVVARGAGTVWPNGTVTVSLGTSPRADYLAGFFVRLNSSSPSSSPHLFRIKSQTWDPESFSVSLLLFANPLDFQLEGQVDYEILAPAGDDMVLEVRGSRTHPSAHGVYDQLTEGDHPSFLQRTTTSLQLNASMLALPAEYDGVYAVLPERVNGKALYKQEEGNNFLFQNGTDSVLYWPAADSGQDRSEGWIFDEAAPASSWVVGDVATQSGERVEMSSLTAIERRHLIQFDQLNSSWVLRDGDRIVFRAASAEKSPGLFLKLWEELEPSSAGNSFVTSDLEIHFQPSASFSDDWGNVAEFQVFHDTELIPKSKSFAQSCFSNVLLQRLIYGSFTSKSFQVQGRDLLVLVRSTTAESCSGEGTCLPRFSMNSTMMMWVKRTGHTVAQIDNGDFDGELDTCPGGWTCQGNVNKSHDWNSPFLVHRVHGSFQPTHLFTYRSRLPPPGIALGPRTGSISQTILHGAHKGDVIRVNFSAAQDWFNGTMSAYLSRPVGQLTVLINDERVFGPITPSPIHYYELQNYSFLARVDRPFSVLTFLYTSYEQDFASDYPAARTIVTAVEITMHSSLLPFEAIELQGSMLHPEFHGEYKKTDVKYGGANVYWKQVPQDISMSSFLFFEHSRGTWMIISNFRLRRGAAPEFVAAGSSFLLTSDGGPEPLHRVAEFGPDYAGVLGAWREWNSSFNANDTTAEEVGLKALQDLFVCKYSNGDGCFYRDSLDMSVKELPSTLQTIFEIPTLAAVDCENFTVGNSNFLVFASFYNDSGIGSYFVDSHVYKYSIDGSFELHQNISTAGATDLEVFELAGQLWMVIAQYFDGLYYTSGSPLYRWVGEEDGKFELFKTFPTKAPRRWKHLLCEGTNFLIVVQGSVHNSTDIYVWKDDVANFELYYSVDQHGDDLAIFEDQCLFVIAGSCDGCTRVYQIHNGLVSMQQSLNIVRAVGLSTFRAASQLVIAVTVGSDAVEAGCGNSTGNSSSPAHVALFASACWDLGEACQSPMWRTIVTNSTITVPESSETAPGPARHLFMDSQHYIMVHSLTETQIWAVDGTGFRGGAESLTFWPEEGANAALVRFSGAAPWDRFDCNATRFYGFEMSSAMRSSYSPSTFAVQGKVP